MSYNNEYNGVITQITRVNNSGTVNQTVTSSQTSVPFFSGNMNEVVFNTMDVNGSPSSSFSTNNFMVTTNTFNGFMGVQSTNVNGNYLIYQSPNNFSVGTYMMEYGLTYGNIRAIIDIAVRLNGSGSYTNVRTQVDCYNPEGDGFYIQFRDYFTMTTGGSPLYIRWLVNGKNSSSTDYWMTLIGPLRVTKLG
jgi:hypothetical protein